LKKLLRKLNKQNGQVLPMALIFLVLAGMVVGPFLSYESAALLSTRIKDTLIDEQYAADAGVEDAIWKLLYTDITDTILVKEKDSVNYLFSADSSDDVNNLDPDVTITKVAAYLARDNFESNSLTGGTGWTSNWQVTGDAEVTPNNQPYEGSFHLQLKSGDESAKRSLDLSGKSSIHLQFYGKVHSLEVGDTAVCQVSSNGVDWATVKTWTDADSDSIYYFYDIDLSSYAPYSSEFWIMFDANMNQVNDWIYFDDVVLKFVSPGAIIMPADDFETGTFTGGVSWLVDWTAEANADVATQQSPYEGTYHLAMKNANSDVQRSADLAGQSGLSVQFWAKARTFEASDTVAFQVSANGIDWATEQTWADGDDDNAYHAFDIDLSSYAPYSSSFWFRFESGMNSNNDYFYADAVQVVGGGAGTGADAEYYDVLCVVGSMIVESTVAIDGSTSGIISWHMD